MQNAIVLGSISNYLLKYIGATRVVLQSQDEFEFNHFSYWNSRIEGNKCWFAILKSEHLHNSFE